MNDELKNFVRKRCNFCGGYFYTLKTELPKYNISMCESCHKKSLNDKVQCMKYYEFLNSSLGKNKK